MVYLIFGHNVIQGKKDSSKEESFGSANNASQSIKKVIDIKPEQALEQFSLDLQLPENYGIYTVTLYDEDAEYIHLFVYNVTNNDINTGNYLFMYEPPSPPKDTKHLYSLNIYKQPDYVEYEKSENFPRAGFPLGLFTEAFILWEQVQFTVGDAPILSVASPYMVTPSAVAQPYSTGTHIPPATRGEHDFFKSNTTLDEQQKKYCSCILKVQAKGGAKVPYAVCAKTVGTTTRDCQVNYDLNKLPDNLLQADLDLHKIHLNSEFTRQGAINAFHNKGY
jgi:phosphatidylethanolamine-binding protein (PEBP) family uncharacterized protein